jgi:hypothetical protein
MGTLGALKESKPHAYEAMKRYNDRSGNCPGSLSMVAGDLTPGHKALLKAWKNKLTAKRSALPGVARIHGVRAGLQDPAWALCDLRPGGRRTYIVEAAVRETREAVNAEIHAA